MFYTQLEAAQKGFVTDAMKIVAEKEHMDEEELRALVALGQVVIPCNKNHTCIDPEGIGKALRTKINVNLGTSRDVTDYDSEIEKVNWAIQLGAESIMDLSTHGDTRIFRRKLTSECKAMIGTVPVYDSVIYHQRDLAELTAEDFLDTIRLHAADIARGIPGARDKDDAMADARRILDWEAQYACALDPEKARNIHESRAPEEGHSETCSMCGKFCAVRSMNKALNSEYIDIL